MLMENLAVENKFEKNLAGKKLLEKKIWKKKQFRIFFSPETPLGHYPLATVHEKFQLDRSSRLVGY